jgi:transposase
MNYVGIDYHKAYSVLAAMNERGQLVKEARIGGNAPVAFAQFFQSLDSPAKVVLEGTRNWGYLYDLLHELEPVAEDNLATHKVAGVREAIESVGARLRYLPPYSPDFNPIENMWSKIKQRLRSLAPRTDAELLEAAADAFESVSPADCLDFFLHANYAI